VTPRWLTTVRSRAQGGDQIVVPGGIDGAKIEDDPPPIDACDDRRRSEPKATR
jgi:hypothetical protein